MTLELAAEDGELAGEGVIAGDSGEGLPLEVTGGEVSGSEVTIEIADAFGGQARQGDLEGELSGDRISGEGRVFSADSSGTEQDSAPFEIERVEG